MYTEKVDHDFKCFKLETLNAFYYTHKKNEFSFSSVGFKFLHWINLWMNKWMKKIKIMCIYAVWFADRKKKGKTLVIEFNWSKLKFFVLNAFILS